MILIYILALLIGLIIEYGMAKVFYDIACMKGHQDRKYFWWSFFFVPIGGLMVVALPDRKNCAANIKEPEIDTHTLKGVTTIPIMPQTDTSKENPSVVKVVAEEEEITCPVCGCKQRANRSVCWKCGVKFEK